MAIYSVLRKREEKVLVVVGVQYHYHQERITTNIMNYKNNNTKMKRIVTTPIYMK